MSLTNYKCLGCSAPISYNPAVAGFKCEYCGRICTEEELERFAQQNEQSQSSSEEILQYNCPNCGAEVVCGDTTTASFCYYCHSPVIIGQRLRGDFKPDKIIPFKISQEQAVAKFSAWIAGKKFLPKDFSLESQREKIIAVYLPYWDIDVEAEIDYQATGITEHSRRIGNREEITTDKYNVIRKGKMNFPAIRSLSFDRIDKNLINAINPFDASQEIAFNSVYLSGFQSERHTITKAKAEEKALKQAQNFALNSLRNSARCRIISEEDRSNYNIRKSSYTLLPVYILNYIYKGENYQFAVNGQTGVAEGNLPTDNKKVGLFSLIIGLIVLILAILGGIYLW